MTAGATRRPPPSVLSLPASRVLTACRAAGPLAPEMRFTESDLQWVRLGWTDWGLRVGTEDCGSRSRRAGRRGAFGRAEAVPIASNEAGIRRFQGWVCANAQSGSGVEGRRAARSEARERHSSKPHDQDREVGRSGVRRRMMLPMTAIANFIRSDRQRQIQ